MLSGGSRPPAWTCLLAGVVQEQLRGRSRKLGVVYTSLCPRCVLNFVRIINRVSKHEDKLVLWPLMRGHNPSERCTAPRVAPWLLPALSAPLSTARGDEVSGEELVPRRGVWCRNPSLPVNTILLSGNHSLRETKYQFIWKTRLTHLS